MNRRRQSPEFTPIHPISPSYRGLLAKGIKIRPRDMTPIRIDRDVAEGMEKIAYNIFADAVNSGMPFIEALSCIYISGLSHGSELTPEKKEHSDG